MTSDFKAAFDRMKAFYADDDQDQEAYDRGAEDAWTICEALTDTTPITAEALAAMGVPRSANVDDAWHLGGDLHLFDMSVMGGTWEAMAIPNRYQNVRVSNPTTCGQVRSLMLGLHDA